MSSAGRWSLGGGPWHFAVEGPRTCESDPSLLRGGVTGRMVEKGATRLDVLVHDLGSSGTPVSEIAKHGEGHAAYRMAGGAWVALGRKRIDRSQSPLGANPMGRWLRQSAGRRARDQMLSGGRWRSRRSSFTQLESPADRPGDRFPRRSSGRPQMVVPVPPATRTAVAPYSRDLRRIR